MSERDELARDIDRGMSDLHNRAPHLKPWMSDESLADHLLAAGWRRPRTVTTAEELDALGPGSVVAMVDGTGEAMNAANSDGRSDFNGLDWAVGGHARTYNSAELVALNAAFDCTFTVLHVGGER